MENERSCQYLFAFTEIFMQNRSDKKSITFAVAGFAGAIDEVPLLEGVPLDQRPSIQSGVILRAHAR